MTFPRDICLLIPLRSVPTASPELQICMTSCFHAWFPGLPACPWTCQALSLSHRAQRSVPLYPQHCGCTRICNISSISSRKASWLSCILCHSIQDYTPIFCPFMLSLRTSQRPFLQPQGHQITCPSPSVNSRNLEGHNCVSLFISGCITQHMGPQSLTKDRAWGPCTGSGALQRLDHQEVLHHCVLNILHF